MAEKLDVEKTSDSVPTSDPPLSHHKAPFKPYLVMAAFMIVGAMTAVGQHLFYGFLHDQPIDSVGIPQSWISRVTTGFIFLFKLCLASVVGAAFCHAFWYQVRRKAIRLDGLDAMFLVLKNPLKFFNKDLILKTQILFILAAISWALPLAGIVTSGSLKGSSSFSRH
jgi:hypothetical protein